MVNLAAAENAVQPQRGHDARAQTQTASGLSYPAYRPFLARVESNEQLSHSFRRLTFSGPLLHHFDDAGLDQRVKLVLPTRPGQRMPDLGQGDDWAPDPFAWRERWKQLEDPSSVRIRTYTAVDIDRDARSLVIDFVVHGSSGPGSAFALSARPGDEVIIAGPDARAPGATMGIDYRPGSAQEILLVADETALPAVRAILRQTPTGADGLTQTSAAPRIHAFVELPTVTDAIDLHSCGHELDLVLRGSERGKNLIDVVTNWCTANPNALRLGETEELAPIDIDHQRLWETATATDGGFYAWLAGEAGVIKELRRLLVKEKQVDRRKVSFMGYWREGHVLSRG